jgi:hypothetical protein
MLQVRKLTRHYHRADIALEQRLGTRRLDWPALVVAFAVGCTALWLCLLLLAAARVLRVALF